MKLIPLTRGLLTKVDDDKYGLLMQWKWYAGKNPSDGKFYAMRQERGADGKQHTVRMHRFLLNAAQGVQGDHWDRDTLNNQMANLRLATHTQNLHNQGKRKNNRSGFRGVFRVESGKYAAQIKVNGHSHHLGRFATPAEAHAAYVAAAVLYRGEFAGV